VVRLLIILAFAAVAVSLVASASAATKPEVQAYLNAVRPPTGEYQQRLRAISVTIDRILFTKTSLARTAVRLRRHGAALRLIAARSEKVKPPSVLATPHRSLTRSFALMAESMNALASGLEVGDFNESAYVGPVTKAQKLQRYWRDEFIVLLRRALIPVPLWLKTLGTE